MKIGFIGAGTVAQTIARHVLPHGHQVLLSNTRGPASLAPLVEELVPALRRHAQQGPTGSSSWRSGVAAALSDGLDTPILGTLATAARAK